MSLGTLLWGKPTPKETAKSALIAQLDKIVAEMGNARHIPNDWFGRANSLAADWAISAQNRLEAKKLAMRIADLGQQYNNSYSEFRSYYNTLRPETTKPYTLGDVYVATKKQIDSIKSGIKNTN
jgi:hypothetical protein